MTPEGKYLSSVEASKKFGASLGTLSSGRTTIIQNSAAYLDKALAIAIRYSAVRKQFVLGNQPEMPIIEYQLQASIKNDSTYLFIKLFCTKF